MNNRIWRIAFVIAFVLLSGCATAPKPSAVAESPAARVVDYALNLQGFPYVYGKASPEEGFDCSGFVFHVYRQNGYPLPRTTEQMALSLPEVDEEQRQAGDLLFFQTGDKPFSHVGIYIGHDSFIHAPSSSTGHVMVSGLDQAYWRQRLIGVRRPFFGDQH